jgi:hypothetical protein
MKKEGKEIKYEMGRGKKGYSTSRNINLYDEE